jgi:hypothetical protein
MISPHRAHEKDRKSYFTAEGAENAEEHEESIQNSRIDFFSLFFSRALMCPLR